MTTSVRVRLDLTFDLCVVLRSGLTTCSIFTGVSADPDTLCPAGGACMPVAFQLCESVEICLKRLSRDSQVSGLGVWKAQHGQQGVLVQVEGEHYKLAEMLKVWMKC